MKIILATPVGSTMHVQTAAWCVSLSKHPEVTWVWAETPAPELGRNAIAEIQLQDPEVTHFFFLDSDTVPPADAINRLMALDQPVAVGVTPIVVGCKHCWNVGTDPMFWPRETPLPEKPFTVDHVGGTTLLIRREVMEAVGFPWFKATWQRMGEHNVELCAEGEDIFFSNRIRACGYEIWVEPSVQCDHYKLINLRTMT